MVFKFELATKSMKHLKSVSYYNHNYYELDLHKQGELMIPRKCNILYQECEDDDFVCYYSLGYFENGKFVACFTWLDEVYEFAGVEIKE